MASILSSLKEMFLSEGRSDDEFSDDFIYWWDDITEEEKYVQEERKSLRETLNENLVLLLHSSILLAVTPLIILVSAVSIYVSIILSIIIFGIVMMSYVLIRNRYIRPRAIMEENLELTRNKDLTGTEELLYSKENYPSLNDYDLFRTDIRNLFKSYQSNFSQLHDEVSLTHSMISNVSQNVDQINLGIDNTIGSTANYQETKGYLTQVSQGIDNLTENFDTSLDAIDDLGRILKSIGKQTTMLALNAGIEAAKAGQRGRGFEVVASNLRRLAQHATDSAVDIQNSSDEINMKARTALETITNSMVAVNEMIDNNHSELVTFNDDLYDSVRDLNAIRSDYSKLIQIIEQGEALLQDYRY